jgi:two-component system, NarL family, nitrate/nitrite response regulator NarL
LVARAPLGTAGTPGISALARSGILRKPHPMPPSPDPTAAPESGRHPSLRLDGAASGTSAPGAGLCPAPIRVLLGVRVRLYREGLRDALERQGRFRVLGAFAEADDLVKAARDEAPDVVVLDMSLCGDRPLARELRREAETVPILALAVDDARMEAVLECASAGMAGWVGTEATLEELARSLEHVARGELVCSARQAALLYGQVGDLLASRSHAAPGQHLTPRETEVAALLATGMSNKGIGRELGIGLATVKNHVHWILAKLEVRTRAEAGARLAAMRFGPTRREHRTEARAPQV